MEFRLDRKAFTLTSFAEEARTNPDLVYWRSPWPSAWRPSSSCGGSTLDLAPDFDEFCALLSAHGAEEA